MNASYFVEICKWWLNLTETILNGEIWNLVKTNFIYGPSHYQMSLLPKSNKEKLNSVYLQVKMKD